MEDKIVFSGMGATGSLHLGHYHAVLKGWCEFQKEHPCYFMIADLAGMATNYQDRSVVRDSIRSILIDWLAAGVDPDRAVLFLQSSVPEHIELAWLLGICTPVHVLEEIPAYYKKRQQAGEDRMLATFGFLGDPLLQAADILLYNAEVVPVGPDSLNHLDFTKAASQRFNRLFCGGRTAVFAIPEARVAETKPVPGTDGRKMSKSLGNSLPLRGSPAEIKERVRSMPTADRGPRTRRIVTDCPVYQLHEIYSCPSERDQISATCSSGQLECSDCKGPLIKTITEEQTLLRNRAERYLSNPALVDDILAEGGRKARAVAQETLREAKDAMGFLQIR